MSTTIKDVARKAGVSVGTVSHVLNSKSGEVSPATQKRVQDAISALGYHPNRVARSLVRGQSTALGVSFVNHGASLSDNPYLAEVLDGMINAASEDGYNITLYTRLPPDDETRHLPLLLDRHVDALCLVAPNVESELPRLLLGARLPFIVVGVQDPFPGVSWVDVDNEAGARMAVECLVRAGHRRIAHFAGPAHQKAAVQRREAFIHALADLSIPFRPEWIVQCGFDVQTAYTEALDLLVAQDRPTAIFAAHDETALGVLRAARDIGLRIPEDLSVIGFDDIREATLSNPPLTTVRQPADRIGHTACKALVGMLSGTIKAPYTKLFEPTLIERNTVSRPPN